MKRLVFCVLLFLSPAIAQDPFPVCALDMRQMVDILADYDVEHQSSISAGAYWGLTDLHERKIYLSNRPDFAYRRLTVIHEFLHICYNYKAVATNGEEGEAAVTEEAKVIYTVLYGMNK